MDRAPINMQMVNGTSDSGRKIGSMAKGNSAIIRTKNIILIALRFFKVIGNTAEELLGKMMMMRMNGDFYVLFTIKYII